MTTLSVVIPAYNEAESLLALLERLAPVLDGLEDCDYEILFVDDGSRDDTLDILRRAAAENPRVRYLAFARNFGHQFALKAGLDHAHGDAVVSMDADLQHPPELIPTLLERWREGYEVVYTLRRESGNEPWLKRTTSRLFYRGLGLLSDGAIEPGAADFRLLDRRVVEALRAINESHLFLRGLIPWVGYRQTAVEYTPDRRYAGKSKYSFSKMLRFAVDGLTSYSSLPLHVSTALGFIVSGLAFVYLVYAVCVALFTEYAVPGWASVLVSVLFLGGLQLIMIGVLGTYLGKVYIEVKGRPLYIIRESNLPADRADSAGGPAP